MDRTLFWSQNQSRTFDYVQGDHDTLYALGYAIQDILGGTPTVVSGMAATQTATPSLTINIGAGRIYQQAAADATANGAIVQDTTVIEQQGINLGTTITLSTAGLTTGKNQWSLIQAQFTQTDNIRASDPNGGLLFFYNSANPSSPYQGPNNDFATTPTVRQGLITFSVVQGAVANTGSEVPPNATSGWVGLYLVDLTYGQTTITTGQILTAGPSVGTGVPSNYPAAPFLAGLLSSHHGGTTGQAPQIKLGSEVQGLLPIANNQSRYYTDSGSVNALAITIGSPAPVSLASLTGVILQVKVINTTTSSTVTLNVNGFGAIPVVYNGGALPNPGVILGGSMIAVCYDGTNFEIISTQAPQLGFSRVVQFPSSITWTVPTGVTRVKITATGGGGSGGGSGTTSASQASVGNGGQAGASGILFTTVSPGQILTITIGAGGAGVSGTTGFTGGTTTVICAAAGIAMSLGGGTGGATFAPASPPIIATVNGTTAAISGCSTVIQGGIGQSGIAMAGGTNSYLGGAGAASIWGSGGGSSGGSLGSNNGNAPPVASYGAGGGGACSGNLAGPFTGGAGVGGVVVIEY